jgi:hypothetical protein
MRPPPPEETLPELPPTLDELVELLRYPVDVPLEEFVWALAERFGALTPPPKVAGVRPVLVDLECLIDAVLHHYGEEPQDEALAELRAGLEMADLPFKGARPS